MINEKILRVYFFYIDKIFLYDLNYKKGTEDYTKLLVSLGMSYLYAGNLEKAQFYLEKAGSLGYDTAVNFKILDSIRSKR